MILLTMKQNDRFFRTKTVIKSGRGLWGIKVGFDLLKFKNLRKNVSKQLCLIRGRQQYLRIIE